MHFRTAGKPRGLEHTALEVKRVDVQRDQAKGSRVWCTPKNLPPLFSTEAKTDSTRQDTQEKPSMVPLVETSFIHPRLSGLHLFQPPTQGTM